MTKCDVRSSTIQKLTSVTNGEKILDILNLFTSTPSRSLSLMASANTDIAFSLESSQNCSIIHGNERNDTKELTVQTMKAWGGSSELTAKKTY